MCRRKCSSQLILLFLMIPNLTISNPVSNPEISTKPGKPNNNLSIQQQQHQQHAQLNTLNAYASNYEIFSNKPNQNQNQNENENFKPSIRLPAMETNFTPIYNSNSISPTSTLASQAPVLMQYMPQTINENGIQYLQLIPTRPLMVPITPYLNGNNGMQSLTYHQHLAPSNSIDYATHPLLSPLPVNVPPPAPSPPLIDIPAALPMPSYGFQSFTDSISPNKQNHRFNRETRDKSLPGPISLNLNEYIPSGNSQQHHNAFHIRGRP